MMTHRDRTRCREETPFYEDMIDYFEGAAYDYHDTLVKLGGRPTRPVLEKPAGKAVYKEKEGRIDIIDENGKLTCTLGYDMSPIYHHWTEECSRFEKELDRWKEFQDYRRNNPQLLPLETAFDVSGTDQPLKEMLARLNEWRIFQVYHQDKVNTALMSTWRNERVLGHLFREEEMSDPLEQLFQEEPFSDRSISEIQSEIGTWLEQLYPGQLALEASQKQLMCIENQGFEMLSEICASLEGMPLLCQKLEKKILDQTNRVYQELQLLEARPSLVAQVSSNTASFDQRVHHWNSETSRLLKELLEWKVFLKWRKRQANADTLVTAEEQVLSGRHMDSAIWLDYVTYRKTEVDKARSYVGCWQRLRKSEEKSLEYRKKAGIPTLGGSVESIQKDVERFQRDVGAAEAQLRSAQQQLTDLLPSDVSGSRTDDRERSEFRVSPTVAHQTLPTYGISESIHTYSIPNQTEDKREKGNDNEGHQLTVSEAGLPDQVIYDDDIQMTDVTGDPCLHEVVGEGKGAEFIGTLMSDVEDPVNPVSTGSPLALGGESKSRNTRVTRKSSLLIQQVPATRKTRSATKLDQAISSRTPKTIGKKPAKKVKVFTENQTETLLNAASTSSPPTIEPASLRRSDRLRKKAEVLANMSPSPQLNAAQSSQSSRQKNPKKQPSVVEPSQSSRQKKPEVQLNALESPQSPSRKRPRTENDRVESSQSSSRKRPRIEEDTDESSQSSSRKRSRTEEDTVESSQPSRQKRLKARGRHQVHQGP